MRLTWILLITFVLYPLLTLGQEASQNSLTVQKALNYAYENEASVNSLQERIEAKKASRLSSMNLSNPQVSYFREGINDGFFTEQRWTIYQTFEFPLTSVLRYRKSDAEYEAMLRQMSAARLDLKARVKIAYTELAYALEIVHLRDTQNSIAIELEQIAVERELVGESSRLDVLQSQIRRSEAFNEYMNAIKELQNKRYNLFNTIGLNPEDQQYDIAFPDTLEYIPIEISQADVLSAIQNSPVVLAGEKYIEAAERQIGINRADFIPDINASYYYQDFSGGYDFTGFEIGLRIPLWFPANQSRNIAVAKRELNAREWDLRNTELTLKMNSEQSWHSFESVKSQINNFEQNIRDQAAELLDLTQEAYRVGEIPLINYLEAQRTYLQSQENYLTALKEYYMRAIELEKLLQQDLVYVD